ncbi:hypothetical protein D6764_02020 [Candidatus Woesearchaeota archaeon]|nr:MAG: hypothetical protein D6764_02020 [Candidatus Woesearchaeota archaeon]
MKKGVQELHEKLRGSSIFKEWKDKNKNAFLANVFSSFEKEDDYDIHFGFYTESDDLLTPFVIDGKGNVTQSKADKVFRHPESIIEEVEIDRVKIEPHEALKSARNDVKSKKPTFNETKAIGILQKKNNTHQWNITLVGQNMDIFNIKINAEDGKIISSSEVKLFEQLK